MIPSDIAFGGGRTITSQPWTRVEHISILETRAAVDVARTVAHTTRIHGCHVLYLGDSMAQLLGSSKGRSSKPGMSRALRQLAAAALAAGVVFHGRRLPSEANPADHPSRQGLRSSSQLHSPPRHDA